MMNRTRSQFKVNKEKGKIRVAKQYERERGSDR